RQRIAGDESNNQHQRDRIGELEAEVVRHRKHLTALTGRAGERQTEVTEIGAAFESAQARHEELVAVRCRLEGERTEADAARRAAPSATKSQACGRRPPPSSATRADSHNVGRHWPSGCRCSKTWSAAMKDCRPA